MKVILKENVESLGKAGDTLKVADGYARNFLIPRGLAIEESSKSMKVLEQEKKIILQRVEKEKKKAELLLEKMKGVTCTISRRVGEQEKLFGSVTTKDIETSLLDQGIAIDRKTIVLEEPIKSLGEFPVKIRLQPGMYSEIKVIVVAGSEE
ncbi:MAG: 50S ribosomal protein L9 [Deltaproteobacteria bacterium]|nr:50S ribosomal protein L9 [Deltaproteobacteria bacterium]